MAKSSIETDMVAHAGIAAVYRKKKTETPTLAGCSCGALEKGYRHTSGISNQY
jgi:hypothetical protein